MSLATAAKAVRYRVAQFVRALTARDVVSERRFEKAAGILSPRGRALFAQQAPQDQLHALAVYETLVDRGYTNRDLLAAALLHDAGKAAVPAPAWQRGVFVLAKRFAPRKLGRLLWDGDGERESPLSTYAQHAEISARQAERAGCSPLTVELIRHHEHHAETCRLAGVEDHPPWTERDRLLAALQAADSVS